MYAVYQSGYAVFGVGRTPEEAVREANKWLDATEEPLTLNDVRTPPGRGEVAGEMCIRPCSENLFETVMSGGGDVQCAIDDTGKLVLASEIDE